MSRLLLLLISVSLAAPVSPVRGQDDPLEISVRAGQTWTSKTSYGAGPAGALSATLYPNASRPSLGVRLEGMLFTGRHRYRGRLPGEHADSVQPRIIDLGYRSSRSGLLALSVRQRSTGERPYRLHAYGGIALTRYPWMDEGDGNGGGVAAGFGLATTRSGLNGIVEFGLIGVADHVEDILLTVVTAGLVF